MIEVRRAGALTTVQDLGRPGYAHLGVPRSGALDPPALTLANRLVGNAPGAAALEITATGCAIRLRRAAAVAVTGAYAEVRVDGRAAQFAAPLSLPAGTTVDVGPARAGVRSYLAVGGGLAVAPVLGSRSTDTLSGLGPAPLRDGDVLPLGTPERFPAADFAPWRPPAGDLLLAVRFGPRADWFTDDARGTLLSTEYKISPMSNRVGARLSGARLGRARGGELPSEGLVLGAVQVPAAGEPLIFLADHPTTGGYPVIAVVEDVTPLAQAGPGTAVRFREVGGPVR
nr:biotin-dependent carboxyltransferase family protein [Micromonospora sp. NBRC 107566]